MDIKPIIQPFVFMQTEPTHIVFLKDIQIVKYPNDPINDHIKFQGCAIQNDKMIFKWDVYKADMDRMKPSLIILGDYEKFLDY